MLEERLAVEWLRWFLKTMHLVLELHQFPGISPQKLHFPL